eukprot:scaffold1435_cov267-Pinguiococcus_pyrenoidosus.AAC.37
MDAPEDFLLALLGMLLCADAALPILRRGCSSGDPPSRTASLAGAVRYAIVAHAEPADASETTSEFFFRCLNSTWRLMGRSQPQCTSMSSFSCTSRSTICKLDVEDSGSARARKRETQLRQSREATAGCGRREQRIH